MEINRFKPSSSAASWLLRNLAGAAVAIIALVAVISIVLAVYTRHNRELEVPDFSGMSLEQAEKAARSAGVVTEVYDSVFVHGLGRGDVFSQNPKAGSMVKGGRRVLLIVNAVNPKQVTMPSLVGLSMRQAKSELDSRGLILGRLVYVNDMATNNVLGQYHGGFEAIPGDMIESGSRIDLKVGLDASEATTFVPDVKGLKYSRALDVIQESSLNVGRIVFRNGPQTYSDTLNAVVSGQSPEPSEESAVIMGTEVSLVFE